MYYINMLKTTPQKYMGIPNSSYYDLLTIGFGPIVVARHPLKDT